MHRSISILLKACFTLWIATSSPFLGQAQSDEGDVEYIVDRYIEAMGGKAALERIRSVRLSGEVVYPDGTKTSITVLKKKPNLVRVTLDTGTMRFIQAYDGETAWYARQIGRNVIYERMSGKQEQNFIREAPLENILVARSIEELKVELGEDVINAGSPCYQVIANLPEGGKIIHQIEKETFLERRIIEYDADGEIISEIIPSKFENVADVTFAMQIKRLEEGRTVSTLRLDDVQVNVGILNTAFVCPVELPEK